MSELSSLPIVSVISSAARPDNWLALYSKIQDTSVPFEVVFVGPNKPSYILPENFEFVQTNVKPVQCYEVAARVARGRYLVPIADDCFFTTPDPLTKLYNNFLLYENTKLMLSCIYGRRIHPIPSTFLFEESFHIHAGDMVNKVYMPVGFIILKEYFRYLGGFDRSFIATYCDLDLCFRVVEDGGITALSDIPLEEQFFEGASTDSLCADYQSEDRNITLKRLWPMFNIHNQFKRTAPVEPFEDRNILTESQGAKGRWR